MVGEVQGTDLLGQARDTGMRAAGLEDLGELGAEEVLARDHARNRAGEFLRDLGERTADAIEDVLAIREKTAAAVEQHQTPRKLASELRAATQDVRRDWDRVAVTELQAAHNAGRAAAIHAQHRGTDPEVYKRPAAGACRWCLRLHIGPDGHPRIFRLSTLEQNGDNVGRRRSDWLPVVGPIHPNCHPAGTLIETAEGQIPIEILRPGMAVVSHKGVLRHVTHAWHDSSSSELITITTADGRSVTATPNHPFLLSSGAWARAESIQLGDDLVCVDVDSRSILNHLHSDQRPPETAKKRLLVRILGLFSRAGVPIPAIDLDGQLYVWEGNVEIDGLERVGDQTDNAARAKSFVEHAFVGRIELSGTRLRVGELCFKRLGPTPDSLVCSAHLPLPLSGGHLLPSHEVGLGTCPLDTSRGTDPVDNRASGDSEAERYFVHREQFVEVESQDFLSVEEQPQPNASGGQSLMESENTHRKQPGDFAQCPQWRTIPEFKDTSDVHVGARHSHSAVVTIVRSASQGEVYNLTVEGDHSFVANGIASHNCRCELLVCPPGWGFSAEGRLVPGGEGGIRYEDERALQKAVRDEDALQKAALVGGDLEVGGLQVRVEANAGDVRRWRAPDGTEGQTVLRFAYGEILGTRGVDGEPVDVYVGPDPTAPFAFVVDQLRADGTLDEQKVFLGFRSPNAVEAAYLLHYPQSFWGSVAQVEVGELRRKLTAATDGFVKADESAVARSNAGSGADDRGWRATSTGSVEEVHHPQHPSATSREVLKVDAQRRKLTKRAGGVAPVLRVALPEEYSPRVKPIPETSSEERDRQRTEEVRRNSAQLAVRAADRRKNARPDPNVARVGSVIPSVPVSLTSG